MLQPPNTTLAAHLKEHFHKQTQGAGDLAASPTSSFRDRPLRQHVLTMDFNYSGLLFNISTLEPTIKNFDIQRAASFAQGTNDEDFTKGLFLFKDSCPNNNCTSACLDPSVVFNSSFTLQNCMVYSAIAGLMSLNNLTTSALAVTDQFGILSDRQIDVNSIQSVINNCLNYTCVSPDVCFGKLSIFDQGVRVADEGPTFIGQNIYAHAV
jgi:hypothetical protein